MEASAVKVTKENPGETPISFDDYKRMTYESGLGEDSREYDFVCRTTDARSWSGRRDQSARSK